MFFQDRLHSTSSEISRPKARADNPRPLGDFLSAQHLVFPRASTPDERSPPRLAAHTSARTRTRFKMCVNSAPTGVDGSQPHSEHTNTKVRPRTSRARPSRGGRLTVQISATRTSGGPDAIEGTRHVQRAERRATVRGSARPHRAKVTSGLSARRAPPAAFRASETRLRTRVAAAARPPPCAGDPGRLWPAATRRVQPPAGTAPRAARVSARAERARPIPAPPRGRSPFPAPRDRLTVAFPVSRVDFAISPTDRAWFFFSGGKRTGAGINQ